MSFIDRALFIAAAAVLAQAATTSGLASAQGPVRAPADATQPDLGNLRRIDRFAHLAAFLNLAQGTVRIVVIVPTDSGASSVIDTVSAVVRSSTSKRLRAYVLLRGAESDAAALAARAADPRVACFWDPTGAVAGAWTSEAPVGAWLYDTSARFADQLPDAALVVLSPADRPARLDGAALRERSVELVRRVEQMVARPERDQ